MIADKLNRPLRDLRISVTDRCNLRCRYCMPPDVFGNDYPFLAREELLDFDEIVRLSRVFAGLGVRKLRVTGGEPLLRPNLPELIARLHEIPGIEDVALTTNGILVPKYADALREAGLKRITISLDSLEDARFGQMNGRGISVRAVLDGIEAAARAGLKVKINTVVQKGVNEDDILPMARHFRGTGHTVRFIEFMDVGNSNGWKLDQVISKREIFERIHAEMPLEPVAPLEFGEVAKRFRYIGSEEEIGIISSVTEAFCSTCTRARLSANGQFYTCLFAGSGHDLRDFMRTGGDSLTEADLAARISEIWNARGDRYSEERMEGTQAARNKIEMSYIGG
ncbi:GTP 3',8-cyclase MoaA [Tumebacillus flagellatus]|uniref:GTP 3',8-cyclase n=1 Tax=Tumebacillus flagellatus TaxID=1157490 RepID=A0A074MD25_9BACL|nr:GTP 3',8-cyclase MoaA [Tumebacillus flagellatus]KEO83777.1 molybdenum cofactor biosynthesis protein A [Tumebacillus flagellatus]